MANLRATNNNVDTGEDIRVGHDANPDILDTFVKDITMAGKGFARGVALDLGGAPVDAIAGLMRAAGVPIPDEPTGGSKYLRRLTRQPLVETDEAAKFGNNVSLLVNPEAGALKLIGAAGILARPTEKAAKVAKIMLDNGASRSNILRGTGVHFSPIGTARREIFDNKAALTETAIGNNFNNRIIASSRARVGDKGTFRVSAQVYPRLDKFMKHDELYTDSVLGERMAKTRVRVEHDGREGKFVKGSWDYDNDTIHLSVPRGASDKDVIETTLHELQHKVQDIQGLEQGASSAHFLTAINNGTLKGAEGAAAKSLAESGYSNESISSIMYWGMAGEIEARAVAARYGMTAEQLSKVPTAYDTRSILTLQRGTEL